MSSETSEPEGVKSSEELKKDEGFQSADATSEELKQDEGFQSADASSTNETQPTGNDDISKDHNPNRPEFYEELLPANKPILDFHKLQEQPVKAMTRHDWKARFPKWRFPLKTPIKKVVVTWTETEQCNSKEECIKRVQEIQNAHMAEQGVPDIKHNFLVSTDGHLIEGRSYEATGPSYLSASAKSHNLTGESIEVAFIDKCSNKPSPLLLKGLSECIAYGANHKFIENSFDLLWLSKDDVIYVQPRMITKR